MIITIQSTDKIVELNGVPARIWQGQTDSGIPCHCYITRIAVKEGRPAKDYVQFETELKEQRKPSADIEAIPLRMIL